MTGHLCTGELKECSLPTVLGRVSLISMSSLGDISRVERNLLDIFLTAPLVSDSSHTLSSRPPVCTPSGAKGSQSFGTFASKWWAAGWLSQWPRSRQYLSDQGERVYSGAAPVSFLLPQITLVTTTLPPLTYLGTVIVFISFSKGC